MSEQLRSEVLQSLLYRLCWIGPVEEVVFDDAVKFIESIPDDLPLPELGLTEAGNVSFDWCEGPLQSITAVVDDSGSVAVILLLGDHHEEWNTIVDDFFCDRTKKLIKLAIDKTIAGFEEVEYGRLLVRKK